MGYYVKILIGFIVLDLYLNLGIARSDSFGLQVLLVILFFPLLKGILILTRVKEFKKIGIHFHQNWLRNIMLGFAIGFSFWMVKYIVQYFLNGFEISGILPASEMLWTLFMILLTFLVGSFLNDVIVRGFVFGHLKGKIPLKWVFLISLLIYVADDAWNQGFSLGNSLFSLVLGFSLTYAIYKTGSIWATTGIHWGQNVCYGFFNGTLGSSGGGILLTHSYSPTFLTESINYLIPLFMFLVILFMRDKFRKVDSFV